MNALAKALADSYVSAHLRGLRGDPQVPEAYERLSSILCEHALSVEHARAALQCFQEGFPTPRELEDVLYNTRSRFLPREPQPAIRPDTRYRDEILNTLTGSTFKEQLQDLKISACRDMLYYTEGAGTKEPHNRAYWNDARRDYLRDHPALVAALREGREPTAAELGPEPTAKIAIANGASPPPVPLTAADLERARQRYEADKEKARAEIAQDQAQREMEDAARAGRQEQGDYSGRQGEEE